MESGQQRRDMNGFRWSTKSGHPCVLWPTPVRPWPDWIMPCQETNQHQINKLKLSILTSRTSRINKWNMFEHALTVHFALRLRSTVSYCPLHSSLSCMLSLEVRTRSSAVTQSAETLVVIQPWHQLNSSNSLFQLPISAKYSTRLQSEQGYQNILPMHAAGTRPPSPPRRLATKPASSGLGRRSSCSRPDTTATSTQPRTTTARNSRSCCHSSLLLVSDPLGSSSFFLSSSSWPRGSRCRSGCSLAPSSVDGHIDLLLNARRRPWPCTVKHWFIFQSPFDCSRSKLIQ